jgi:hypothetical protein
MVIKIRFMGKKKNPNRRAMQTCNINRTREYLNMFYLKKEFTFEISTEMNKLNLCSFPSYHTLAGGHPHTISI